MRVLLIITLITAAVTAAAAQQKAITEAEFKDIDSKTQKELYKGLHGPIRVTVDSEVTGDGPETDYQSKMVILKVPGKGSHSTSKSSFGGKARESEDVSLGSRSFTRGSDGIWKEVEQRPNVAAAETSTPAKPIQDSTTKEYKYLGLQSYGSRKVHVYSSFESSRTSAPNAAVSESSSLIRVFIGEDGNFYRYEADSVAHMPARDGHIKIRIEITADPSITIAVPEVAK